MVYLVENLHRFVELYIPQEGRQVLEQVNQQLSIHGPTLEDKKIQSRHPLRVRLIHLVQFPLQQMFVSQDGGECVVLTFCCGVCASILAMKIRCEMSSSQA